MNQTDTNDTIIEEIHETRRQMAEKFGGQIAAIVDDARKRQAASGRPIWQRKSSNSLLHIRGENEMDGGHEADRDAG
jgi:hypothetical protein